MPGGEKYVKLFAFYERIYVIVMKNTTIVVCGIDTGVGKSVVTGLLAGFLLAGGHTVITQKPVQTGCSGKPEDIVLHRRLMGIGWNDLDQQNLTCSYCFPFPASPHLAAALAGSSIEPEVIRRASQTLASDHEYLLVEGAGGLLVPLNEEVVQLDYFQQCGYPMVLVTSPRLGSINHTLLALEALRSRDMHLLGLVYNLHGTNPKEIVQDSLQVFRKAMTGYGFTGPILLLPDIDESRSVNWQPLLKGLPA